MDILLSFIQTLLISFLEMFYLVGVIIIIGLILGVLERLSNTYLVRAFGAKGVMVTAWIGTPIHEIGHLIQCFIWGHRVSRIKLLQLNHPSGILGFVEHHYNPNSMYQQVGNFFIGLGPIFSGIGSLILGMYFLVPDSFFAFKTELQRRIKFEQLDITLLKTIVESVSVISKNLFTLENLINPLFWIFLVIAFSISSHIALSTADIRGSAKGLSTIFFILFLFNIISRILNWDTYEMIIKLAGYNAYVLAFGSIALLFSFITLVISILLFNAKRLWVR
ncbi:hypothetical protein L1999_15950 [Neobacillus drentensis]|uniref:hypothetical protein n=1 Tax=Neobacillus drentensis TaxID=220684 RepID=UPI001F285827|nr:hypothetical protein [Neobacillus drentensis]ULT54650.1 hypothetical protein L1999_15950 [Neobacillus drentensis]